VIIVIDQFAATIWSATASNSAKVVSAFFLDSWWYFSELQTTTTPNTHTAPGHATLFGAAAYTTATALWRNDWWDSKKKPHGDIGRG